MMTTANVLNVEKKKGDPDRLDGQVTVYARVDVDPAEMLTSNNPALGMVQGGIIAVQGNYREQHSMRDFLREMGIMIDGPSGGGGVAQLESDETSLEEFLSDMGGVESALDPKKFREKLNEIEEIEDFIPTPAKIVPFNSEQEVLAQTGDIYFAGFYKKVGNAILGINAIPILYQALFREQQMLSLKNEIDALVSQVESGGEWDGTTVLTPGVDPAELLLKTYIPKLLYLRGDAISFPAAEKQFRAFMSGYRFNSDVETIIKLITENRGGVEYRLLELYTQKIVAVLAEDFSAADKINKEIDAVTKSAGE